MNKGKRKYTCEDCGHCQLNWASEFGMGKTNKVRCKSCASTFLTPMTDGAITEFLRMSEVRAEIVRAPGGRSSTERRLSRRRVITSDDVRRKARKKDVRDE